MPPPAATDMDVDNPDLEVFHQRWREEAGLPSVESRVRYREVSEASSSTMRAMSSIESTSSTIRGTPEVPWPPDFDSYLSADDRMDTDPPEASGSPSISPARPSIIIATDFGTTFSSVAFTRRRLGRMERPQSIINYPYDPNTNGKVSFEVPTESWYPDVSKVSEYLDETALTTTNGEEVDNIYDDDDDIDQPLPYVRSRHHTNRGEDRRFNEDPEIGVDEEQESVDNDDERPLFFWGYGTQEMTRFPGMNPSQFRRVARSKLMLDESPKTQTVRDSLRPILNQLKRRKIIKKDEDVIADYLSQLFQHTKQQLKLNHNFTESETVEHVLCVPNIWSSKACRTMQKTMETAIRRSGLGSLNNLFIVAEPEAAATFVLHHNINIRIKPGETFVIVDAGGGTVDVTTYTVHKQYPLRLKREAVEPTGDLFGSSYLNEAFREYLLKRLEGEDYLETESSTLDNKVDEAMIDFENRLKRSVNLCGNPDNKIKTILTAKIQGLKRKPTKRFIEDHVLVSRNELFPIFKPLLKGIAGLMKEQLRLANEAGLQVQKVVLIGGFAGSPTLREYLKTKLENISRNYEEPVELVAPDSCFETAVSLGAVLRALEKEDGPARITQSSYGFLRTEPHEPEVWEAHGEVRPTIDKYDGKDYVRNTIDWLVKKGETLPARKEYPIEVEHTFSETRKYFKCEEILYVSDTSTESHYRRTHPKNKGAEIAGRIIADMTFLRDEGHIQLTHPKKGYMGKKHWKVEFELVMIVEGRNLRYEARWPKGSGGEVKGRGQICIAAAFEPGTS